MDRRTFITTSTAAAVGLGANSLLTGRAQEPVARSGGEGILRIFSRGRARRLS
jgi:hypothetical protein